MRKSVRLRRAIITIEDIINESNDYLTTEEILKIANVRGIKTSTFDEAMDWLFDSGKIIMDDRDDTIIWVAVDNKRLKKLLKESVRVR